MLSESEIKEVMDKYEIDDEYVKNPRPAKWRMSDAETLDIFKSSGYSGTAFKVETVSELETILKCLGIPKKPETFETELYRDDLLNPNWHAQTGNKIIDLHNKYLNCALDEIEKYILDVRKNHPMTSYYDISIDDILSEITKQRPK